MILFSRTILLLIAHRIWAWNFTLTDFKHSTNILATNAWTHKKSFKWYMLWRQSVHVVHSMVMVIRFITTSFLFMEHNLHIFLIDKSAHDFSLCFPRQKHFPSIHEGFPVHHYLQAVPRMKWQCFEAEMQESKWENVK